MPDYTIVARKPASGFPCSRIRILVSEICGYSPWLASPLILFDRPSTMIQRIGRGAWSRASENHLLNPLMHLITKQTNPSFSGLLSGVTAQCSPPPLILSAPRWVCWESPVMWNWSCEWLFCPVLKQTITAPVVLLSCQPQEKFTYLVPWKSRKSPQRYRRHCGKPLSYQLDLVTVPRRYLQPISRHHPDGNIWSLGAGRIISCLDLRSPVEGSL